MEAPCCLTYVPGIVAVTSGMPEGPCRVVCQPTCCVCQRRIAWTPELRAKAVIVVRTEMMADALRRAFREKGKA